jgi:cytochrome c oxidase subunit 2
MGGPLLLAVGEPPKNLSIFDPAAPPAASVRDLSILVLAITGVIFVVVEFIIFYSYFRFRRKAASGADEPPQVYGSKPIEIAWTVAPALIVLILVLVTARTLWDVKRPPPTPQPDDRALFVTVVGRQWWWELRYDHYNGDKLGFITANELHVPASEDPKRPRRVYLTLQSADVCHSFWVPRLAGKTDLIPGQTNQMWLQVKQNPDDPDRPVLFVGQCAEYCGTQHAKMLLRVVVEPPERFQKWLDEQAAPAATPQTEDAKKGRQAFRDQSCINCHRVREYRLGQEPPRPDTPRGGYAPDLTHLMSRETLAAGIEPNTPEKLDQWVKDPQTLKPGCLMPAFGLSDREREAVVRYLQTLR